MLSIGHKKFANLFLFTASIPKHSPINAARGAETEMAAKDFIDSSQIPLLLNNIKYEKHAPPNKANLQPLK